MAQRTKAVKGKSLSESSGEYKKWLEAAQIASEYPSVILGLYVSLLPALMPILGCPNFCFEWSGRTSTGKTTALRFAASAWADPAKTSTWTKPGKPTPGRPLLVDDTSCAKNGMTPIQTVYAITSGPTRTVLMSTGEKPIIAFTNGGGVLARVISLSGGPFGKDDLQTSQDVSDLIRMTQENYGFIGPMFTEKMEEFKESWPGWRESYAQLDREFRGQAVLSGGVADRLAGYAASIKMTADLVHSFFPELAWSPAEAVQTLWLWIVTHGCADDRSYKAAMEVQDWANDHRGLFWDKGLDRPTPEKGWFGRWDAGGPLYFYPAHLRILLESLDYDGSKTVKEWRHRGWVQNGQSKLNPRVGIGSETYSLIHFRPPAARMFESQS